MVGKCQGSQLQTLNNLKSQDFCLVIDHGSLAVSGLTWPSKRAELRCAHRFFSSLALLALVAANRSNVDAVVTFRVQEKKWLSKDFAKRHGTCDAYEQRRRWRLKEVGRCRYREKGQK